MSKKSIEDILSRCKAEGDCMIWQGAVHRQGYGFARDGDKMQTTHRIVGLLTHGNPGHRKDYVFTQTCKNKLCCNPEHITVEETSTMMKNSYYDNGETRTLRSAKDGTQITREQIEYIRSYDHGGNWGETAKLARTLGVKRQTVDRILRGEIYKWIK